MRKQGITLVLDVGANAGWYGSGLRKNARYLGRILSFEPVTEPFEALARLSADDPNWECRQLALSSHDGAADMTVTAATEFSSFLPLRKATTGGGRVGTQNVSTARLDSLSVIGPQDVVMLKLDVQGFEPAVLAGAAETLERVTLLETEVILADVYEGQPTFREMVDLCDDLGFRPISFALGNLNYSTGELGFLDILFGRKPS
jgi:FkbM family methyltransferase